MNKKVQMAPRSQKGQGNPLFPGASRGTSPTISYLDLMICTLSHNTPEIFLNFLKKQVYLLVQTEFVIQELLTSLQKNIY